MFSDPCAPNLVPGCLETIGKGLILCSGSPTDYGVIGTRCIQKGQPSQL